MAGRVGAIMITNGGPHPADRWAEVSADLITNLIEIDENSDTPEARTARLAKQRLKLDLTEALEPIHSKHQDHERGEIKKKGFARLAEKLHPDEAAMDEAVKVIVAKTKGTPFEPHFRDPGVQQVLKNTIGSHFTTAADIERSWHADRNSNHPEARAYRAARDAHGGANVHLRIAEYRGLPQEAVPEENPKAR